MAQLCVFASIVAQHHGSDFIAGVSAKTVSFGCPKLKLIKLGARVSNASNLGVGDHMVLPELGHCVRRCHHAQNVTTRTKCGQWTYFNPVVSCAEGRERITV